MSRIRLMTDDAPASPSPYLSFAGRLAAALALLLIMYCFSFVGLSLLGGYSDRLAITGRYRYWFGLGMPDGVVWQPLFIKGDEAPEPNLLDMIYYPALRLDRLYWHKPVYIDQFAEADHLGQGIGAARAVVGVLFLLLSVATLAFGTSTRLQRRLRLSLRVLWRHRLEEDSRDTDRNEAEDGGREPD